MNKAKSSVEVSTPQNSKQDGTEKSNLRCLIRKLAAKIRELKNNTPASSNQFNYTRDPLRLEERLLRKETI